jgi:hypothetical protein
MTVLPCPLLSAEPRKLILPWCIHARRNELRLLTRVRKADRRVA